MLGKQKCSKHRILCVLSLHLSQEVSDCVMKARLTGVQFKDAQYSQYTLQSSFTLDVHFPPDVGNIDGPIDWFEGCGDCTGVPAGPSSQRSSSRGCCQPCQTGKDIYPYSPPPLQLCPDVKTASTFGRAVCSADCESRFQCVECAALSLEHLLWKVGSLGKKWLTETEKAFLASTVNHRVVFKKPEQIPHTIHFPVYNWSARPRDTAQEF